MGTKIIAPCRGLVFVPNLRMLLPFYQISWRITAHVSWMRFYVSEVMIPSGKSISRWGFLRPFGPCMEDRHEHYQYRDSCPCRRWKDDLDGEPAICQRSHFRTGERRKRDNEDGHHAFGATAWDYHSMRMMLMSEIICWLKFLILVIQLLKHGLRQNNHQKNSLVATPWQQKIR